MNTVTKQIYLFRSTGPILKIMAVRNRYWQLFVDHWGSDVFEDESEAIAAVVEKRSVFAEWDEISDVCPSDLTNLERI